MREALPTEAGVAATAAEALAAAAAAPRRGLPVSVWIGLVIIAVNAFAALFGPLLAPYGESAVVGDVWEPVSAAHWLGTDNLGRDLFARLLYGAQTSIAIALAITLLSFTIGVVLGFFAAVIGGWADQVLSRLVDVLMAFPTLILALLVLSVLGSSVPVLIAWLVLEVGAFASRNVGHIAERDLLAVVPLLFLALAAWLQRRAPRPPLGIAAAIVVVVAAVVYLPVSRFVNRSEFADAFTIVPLVRLDERWTGFDPELWVTLGALIVLVAALVLPRRALLVLPAVIAVLLAAASVSTSRSLAADSRTLQNVTTGADRTWVDGLGADDVLFVWSGDMYTIVPWSLRFWNDAVTRVVKLQDVYLEGPVPQPLAATATDGRLLVEDTAVESEFTAASSSIRFFGTPLGSGGPLTLWRVEPPLRISHVFEGVRYDRTADPSAQIVVYACEGGSLAFRLVADGDRRVELLQSNVVVDTRELKEGEAWEGSLAAVSAGGVCTVGVRADGVLRLERFDFERA